MRKRIILYLLFLSSLQVFAQNDMLIFDKITSEQGLSNNQINCLLKDRLGFLWIGTNDGLNRYDGNSVKVFKHTPSDSSSLGGSRIISLFEDSEGYLWIGLRDNGVSRFDFKTEKFKNYTHIDKDQKSLVGNEVLAFHEDLRKRIWISTYQGLSILDKKTGAFENYSSKTSNMFKSDGIFTFIEDAQQNIWCFSFSSQITVFHQKTNQFEFADCPTEGTYWKKVVRDDDGFFWIVCYGCGLVKYDPITRKVVANYKDVIGDSRIRSIQIDDDRNIVLASDGGGFIRFNPKTAEVRKYMHSKFNLKSIASDALYTLLYDKQGILWLGTFNKGLNVYDKKRFKFELFKNDPERNASLTNKSVISVFEDSRKRVWIGSDGDGLFLFDRANASFVQYKHDDKDKNTISSNVIISIAEDAKGNLLLGTWNGGLNVFNPDKKKNISFVPNTSLEDARLYKGIASKHVWKILRTKSGRIYLGYLRVFNGVSLQEYNESEHTFQNVPIDGLASNVMTLLEDSKGNIWIGTENGGTFVYHPDRSVEKFVVDPRKKNWVSHNDIRAIYEDESGLIWLGSEGGGLNAYNPQTRQFKVFTENDGLVSNAVHGILKDKEGGMWLACSKGLSHFDPRKNVFHNYGSGDGIQEGAFNQNACCQISTGEFFFCGTEGLNVFEPSKIKINQEKQKVNVTKFLIQNSEVKINDELGLLSQSILFTKEIVIPHRYSNMFAFEYAALAFSGQDKVKYAYMLEGFNKDWIYSDRQRSATFTNIDAGQYVFRVKATNSDGVWSKDEARVLVTVLPPFWQTWWFRTLFVSFVIGSIVGFFLIRLRIVHQQKIALEEKVVVRTAELKSANDNLKMQQEEILARNEEISQLAEELSAQRDDLEIHNKAISEKNKQITSQHEYIKSSIRYAYTMQQAVLPDQTVFDSSFADAFILYQPKDIVSGDFYWLSSPLKSSAGKSGSIDRIHSQRFLAVADCTGHGVPGAFMVMIGNRLLSELINEELLDSPAQVLSMLDLRIKQTLKQDISENNDGLDICLCKFEDTEEGIRLTYSGANSRFYHYSPHDHTLRILKTQHKYIGGGNLRTRSENVPFADAEVLLQKGDLLYLFTDGVVDQNNIDRKRIGSLNLQKVIMENVALPMLEQMQLLDAFIKNWQEGTEQRDDITMLGLKL